MDKGYARPYGTSCPQGDLDGLSEVARRIDWESAREMTEKRAKG